MPTPALVYSEALERALGSIVRETNAQMAIIIARGEQAIANLQARLAEAETRQVAAEKRQADLEAELRTMAAARVAEIEADVTARVAARLAEVRNGTDHDPAEVAELRANVTALHEDVSRAINDTARLEAAAESDRLSTGARIDAIEETRRTEADDLGKAIAAEFTKTEARIVRAEDFANITRLRLEEQAAAAAPRIEALEAGVAEATERLGNAEKAIDVANQEGVVAEERTTALAQGLTALEERTMHRLHDLSERIAAEANARDEADAAATSRAADEAAEMAAALAVLRRENAETWAAARERADADRRITATDIGQLGGDLRAEIAAEAEARVTATDGLAQTIGQTRETAASMRGDIDQFITGVAARVGAVEERVLADRSWTKEEAGRIEKRLAAQVADAFEAVTNASGARFADVEARLADLSTRLGGDVLAAVDAAIHNVQARLTGELTSRADELATALNERIDEAREAALRAVVAEVGSIDRDALRGPAGTMPIATVWTDEVHYAGAVVTHAGATWQARRDTGKEPRAGSPDWICLVPAPSEPRSFRLRGTYDPASQYDELDVVVIKGSSFVAKRNDPGDCPGDGWQLNAQTGRPGEKVKGDDGKAAPKIMGVDLDDTQLVFRFDQGAPDLRVDLYPVLKSIIP